MSHCIFRQSFKLFYSLIHPGHVAEAEAEAEAAADSVYMRTCRETDPAFLHQHNLQVSRPVGVAKREISTHPSKDYFNFFKIKHFSFTIVTRI